MSIEWQSLKTDCAKQQTKVISASILRGQMELLSKSREVMSFYSVTKLIILYPQNVMNQFNFEKPCDLFYQRETAR